jgi:hypothetical protein
VAPPALEVQLKKQHVFLDLAVVHEEQLSTVWGKYEFFEVFYVIICAQRQRQCKITK